MVKLILKGSFSRPVGAVATVLIVALMVILLYSAFNFQGLSYDYFLGEKDCEAGSSDIIVSKSGIGASLIPIGAIKNRTDIDYAIGSLALYCMYNGRNGEEAIYLRAFEKNEIDILHNIYPLYPKSKEPSKILMDSVIISKAFADSKGLTVGDKIELSILGKTAPFYVEIIAENNGYFYNNPNVIVGVNDYVSTLMNWPIGKIYNKIYISVNNKHNVQAIIDSISQDPTYLKTEVKLSFDETERKEKISMYTMLFNFAVAAIIALALLMVYKLYQLMFYKKIENTIKLKVIGLSIKKIILIYALESLILTFLGSLVGVLTAVPLLKIIVNKTVPNMTISTFSLLNAFIAFILGIIIPLLISLFPIINSTKRSIRENMSFSKSPRKGSRLIVSLILVFASIVLIILEKTIIPIKGVLGLTNAIIVPITFMIIMPTISFFLGQLLRKSKNRNVFLSSIYIGKNESLNISTQLLITSIILAIFFANILGLIFTHTNNYLKYAEDKLLIVNSGSLSKNDLLSLKDLPGITEVIPTLEIQGQSTFKNEKKSVYTVGINGHDLSSFFDIAPSANIEELETKLSESANYIVISNTYRHTQNLSVGDTFSLEYKNIKKDYEIIGFISTNYKNGNIAFVNRIILSDDFSLDNQNLIYLTSSSLTESKLSVSNLLSGHNIQVVKLNSVVEPLVKANSSLLNFLRAFGFFILFMVFSGVIINTLMSRAQRKTDTIKILLLGVSKKQFLLNSFLEGIFASIPAMFLGFLGGFLMFSSALNATIFFGFYKSLSFQIMKSIFLSFFFFLIYSLISPIYFLLNKPKSIPSTLKSA